MTVTERVIKSLYLSKSLDEAVKQYQIENRFPTYNGAINFLINQGLKKG